jgi:hypothetical protein
MSDEELTKELKRLASVLNLDVKKICQILETINPGEYQRLYRGLFNKDATLQEYDHLLRLTSRLERLALRLDDDGQYTNANICWLALAELEKK